MELICVSIKQGSTRFLVSAPETIVNEKYLDARPNRQLNC